MAVNPEIGVYPSHYPFVVGIFPSKPPWLRKFPYSHSRMVIVFRLESCSTSERCHLGSAGGLDGKKDMVDILGVSIVMGGTPEWFIIYNGKSHQNGWFTAVDLGPPLFPTKPRKRSCRVQKDYTLLHGLKREQSWVLGLFTNWLIGNVFWKSLPIDAILRVNLLMKQPTCIVCVCMHIEYTCF